MKKLLNPKLNTNEVTVLDDVSPDENPEIKKASRKGKKPAAVKYPYVHPAELKSSSRSLEYSSKPASKLSAIILEIKDKLLKQQQEEKEKACPLENQEWDEEDEAILRKAGIIEESILHVDFSYFLMQDANVLENPSFDDESLQERVQKYKQQVKQLQETNDSLFKVNKGLIEELQDAHHHFLQLSEVSKEVLKRKKATDMYSTKLKKTVESLQQENEYLQKKIADMEKKHKRTKRRSQNLDGLDLLAEVAKEL